MTMKDETKITRAIIAYIKEVEHGDAYHVHGSTLQRGGEPDIAGEVWLPAAGIWCHLRVEVKTPQGEPTERQMYRLKHYWKAGYLAGVVTSVADFKKLLTNYHVWRVSLQHAPASRFSSWGNLYAMELHDAEHNKYIMEASSTDARLRQGGA